MDVTFNLERNNYRRFKPGYIDISSNHSPEIIKHLTQTIGERLSRNSSSAEIFEQWKPDCEEALEKCGYKPKLQYKNQICSKITSEEKYAKKLFGLTHLSV